MTGRGRQDGGKRRGAMTDAEARAEREYLGPLKAAGEIYAYAYEAIKLRCGYKTLASGKLQALYYTPDWFVIPTARDVPLEIWEQIGRSERHTIARMHAAEAANPWFVYKILWQRKRSFELQPL